MVRVAVQAFVMPLGKTDRVAAIAKRGFAFGQFIETISAESAKVPRSLCVTCVSLTRGGSSPVSFPQTSRLFAYIS